MFNFEKPLELPPQLSWKYRDEPAFMNWTIRARNYSTVIANAAFAFFLCLGLTGAIVFYKMDEGIPEPWRTLGATAPLLLVTFFAWLGYGQRVNLAYRFAETGWEYCQWKDTPKWHLTMVKWVTGIMAVAFIYMATIDPSFILGALIGPGGMALTYLSMANSKSYQEMHSEYNHITFKWCEMKQVAIATNRDIVDLKYSRAKESVNRPVVRNVNVFCKRGQKEVVANAIKPCMAPGTPFIWAKLNLLLDTD
jgi:hypothetical protein